MALKQNMNLKVVPDSFKKKKKKTSCHSDLVLSKGEKKKKDIQNDCLCVSNPIIQPLPFLPLFHIVCVWRFIIRFSYFSLLTSHLCLYFCVVLRKSAELNSQMGSCLERLLLHTRQAWIFFFNIYFLVFCEIYAYIYRYGLLGRLKEHFWKMGRV